MMMMMMMMMMMGRDVREGEGKWYPHFGEKVTPLLVTSVMCRDGY